MDKVAFLIVKDVKIKIFEKHKKRRPFRKLRTEGFRNRVMFDLYFPLHRVDTVYTKRL